LLDYSHIATEKRKAHDSAQNRAQQAIVWHMNPPVTGSVRIYHNNLWARYKGVIFSKVFESSGRSGISTSFVQIVETSLTRKDLGGTDRSYHQYPYKLLFTGPGESVPWYKMIASLAMDLIKNPSDLCVLPGYHRYEYWMMLIICVLLRRKRAVFCDSTAFDEEKSPWKEKAKALFFRRCDGFFCYGIRSKEYVASYAVDPKKIYDGCQAAALAHDYDAAGIRAYYTGGSSPSASFKFLYVGRLSKEKGLFDLLDAFSKIYRQNPEARLALAGPGLIEEALRQRAKVLGIESAVALLGTRSPEEIGKLLMGSTAMILPSHREPWGLVVNEALSFGCPVVVSDVCGCVPELVREGITGYSFPAGDVGALAQAMSKAQLLSQDRAAVALRCLELIEKFTPQRAAAQILRGCVSILGHPQ
jgi:glycosyltransferase involved in cell wall biosynthesis